MRFTTLLSAVARTVWRRTLTGNVDVFTTERLTGWIITPEDSGTPVRLSLHIDGVLALNILADQPRADVLAAGLGPLHCGYDVSLPSRLRDGQAHLVELRRGADGPVLWKGRRKIAASAGARSGGRSESQTFAQDGAAVALSGLAAQQGVAYLDRRRAAIAGWATGCGAVTLRLDDGAPVVLTLDRAVPGLGGGAQQGFFYPLPAALLDGADHQVTVSFQPGGAALDGSPVRFHLHPGHPLVEIVSLIGCQIRLRLRDASGAPARLPVALEVGGPFNRHRMDLRLEAGLVCADLPETAQELLLLDTGVTPASLLARYSISPRAPGPCGQAASSALSLVEQPAGRLGTAALRAVLADPAHIAQAGQAFAAFCARPDARFDPLWYSQTYLTPAPLAHYQQTGAQAGCAPGPLFDEAAARLRYPDLAAAIAAGQLPCAFALELVLPEAGPETAPEMSPEMALPEQGLVQGRLGAPAGLDPAMARNLAWLALHPQDDPATLLRGLREAEIEPHIPPQIQPQLPDPTASQSAADSVYAAWFDRLAIDAATRATITADEAAIRQSITATRLTRTPLISIIMPSYNRAYTIGEAVQSVLDQSYQNWELLVCDDASDDKTAEVMRGFDDPRIRYMPFTKSNGAGTRNKGLRFATGEYIAYLDSDNIWHPLFLDLMLRRLMAAPGSALAYCAYLDTEIVGAKVTLHKISSTPFRPIPLASRNFMDLNTIIHHRRVYDWMGGFDESLPRLQDWDLMLRYTSIFTPLFVDHAAVFYRRNVAWGQVTHLFQNSGAQNTVNDKTNRRLTQGHERLQIAWPERGRITVVLGGGTPGNDLLALNLARLAAGVADVDLLDLTGTLDTGTPDTGTLNLDLQEADAGITLHRAPASLQRDPDRLSHAMAPLLRGRVVLSVGLGAGFLQAIPGVQADRCYRLLSTAQGLALVHLRDAQRVFHLGALPLPELRMPELRAPGLSQPPCLLLLPGDAAPDVQSLATQAKARSMAILLPPAAGLAGWQRLSDGVIEDLTQAPGSLPAELGTCSMAASLRPLSGLPAFEFCLLNALQGQGIPLAVLREGPNERSTALADQWIDARAAYEIKVAKPAWVLDKIGKLHGDSQSYATLAARGQKIHQIYLHPDLCQERLSHLVYRLLHETPIRETLHADP